MGSVLYIGTDEGVVVARSQDQDNWHVAEHGLKKWEVTELAIAPNAPNKVFAGTRGDGVWVSEDFGKTWRKPSYGKRGPGKVRSLTIDPHDPRRLYAGCEPVDVFSSDDEGKTWRCLDSIWEMPSVPSMSYPLASTEPHVRDVTVDPADPNVLYVALQLGHILKSVDGGLTWTLLDNNLDCDVHVVLIDPVNSDRLIAATGGHGARRGEAPGRALYASDDAGTTWTPVAMNFLQDYAVPLVRDPHDPARLYCALANGTAGRWRQRDSGAEAVVIRSTDGGKTWKATGAGIGGRQFPEAIVADHITAGRIYAGSRRGDFYVSDDAGDTWHSMSLDLRIADLSCMSVTHA